MCQIGSQQASQTLRVMLDLLTMKNPFTRAREKRGWTFTGAANRMHAITEQQLRNLEGIGNTRETEPGHVRVETALEIVRAYWPDISLQHFVEDTDLKACPRDSESRRKLKGYVEL